MAVLVYLVDEKEGEDLDSLFSVAQLLVQVSLDGAADLRFLQNVFIHRTNRPAQGYLRRVSELDVFVSRRTVDSIDRVAFVQLSLTGEKEQVISRLEGDGFPFHNAGFLFDIHLNFGAEPFFVGDRQKPDVCLVVAALDLAGKHRNLLHKTQLESVNRGQPVKKVDLLPVGCGIPQHTHGVQRADRLFRLGGVVHALGFVDDDNGVGILNQPDRAAAAQPILILIEDVLGLFESVDVDNHNLNLGAGGKLPHVVELRGVVDKKPAGHIVILEAEVFLCHLKGLVDALPDGDRRHHHHELGEAIPAVQLKDGFGVNIGFAGAGFHLDAELMGFGAVGQGQKIPLLDAVHILGQGRIVDEQLVGSSHLVNEGRLAQVCR